jgi:hypothetical protein
MGNANGRITSAHCPEDDSLNGISAEIGITTVTL